MDDLITIASPGLSATINPFGAELTSFIDPDGADLMTDADPAYWTGRAPILFPIVGALANGRYRLDGVEYAMPKHGFARRSTFEVVAARESRAIFRLEANAETRAIYPFEFALQVDFRLHHATLTIETTLLNTGDRDLPASFGYHPAFAWPLPMQGMLGGERSDHAIVFDTDEPHALLGLSPDGLIAGSRTNPLHGRTLRLADDLFANDALIWSPVASRGLSYGVDSAPQLRIEWDAPELGIWTKPGSAFACVEPWWGHADPVGFDGEIWDKPGIMRLAPREQRTFGMSITLTS